MMSENDDYLRHWSDHPENPLIAPPFPEFLLGDPTVVLPGESPDGLWHMFANTLTGIHHFTSTDGVHWRRRARVFGGMRAFVFREDGVFYLFYEEFSVPMFRSHVALRTSTDLWEWSERRIVLEPALGWERVLGHTCGNPCLVKVGDRYRLYYSAALVFLRDLGFCEPLHIGAAEGDIPIGPFEKLPEPILSPSADDPFMNLGAGAIKVIRVEERGLHYGFINGIYRDPEGRSRSAIMLLSSAEGLEWQRVYEEPVISPAGRGWKRSLVYQLDVRRVGDEMWLWYNARSGWRFGVERIGLATSPA